MQCNTDYSYWLRVYEKMYLCRKFEELVIEFVKQKKIKSPVYLSVGQESIPATISEHPIIKKIDEKPAIFAQHRAHSWFLCFGGKPADLLEQIMGPRGSASISCKDINMFGHSGLLGDQVPIAVGYAKATNKFTICVMGDAAAEEDYALGAMGYAATHKLPIIFIVEDNNLSILTKKNERRSWSIVDVAKSLGVTTDSYYEAIPKKLDINLPILLNIDTSRHLFHCGIGKDNIPKYDILDVIKNKLNKYDIENVEKICQEQLNIK